MPSKCKPNYNYFKEKKYFKVKRYPVRKWTNSKAGKMDFIDRSKVPGPSRYFENPGRKVTIYKDEIINGVEHLSRKVKKIYEYKRRIN